MANQMPSEVTPQDDFRNTTIFQIRGQNNFYYPDRRLTPENAELLKNMNLTERGTARRTFGSSKYNSNQITESSAAKDVTGLKQVTFSGGTEKNVECAGTKVYTNDGTTRADVTGSLSLTDNADNRFVFEQIKDQLIFTNGVDETITYNGSGNATALAGVPWTTCKSLVVHKNLLIALNTTESTVKYPTRIRWPDVTMGELSIDVTNWPAGSRFEVQQGGPPIIGGLDIVDFLAVIKEDGVHLVRFVVDAGFIEAVPERALTGAFSPIAPNGLVRNPSFGMFIIAKDGAYSVRNDLSFDLLTQGIQFEWNNLNPTRIGDAVSWIRETDHQVRTLMSSATNSVGHDKELVWDWETGDVWFDTPSRSYNYAASYRVSGEEFDYKGSTEGYVYKANDSAQADDDGEDTEWKITMSPNDLGSPGKDKIIHSIVTHYVAQEGEQSLRFACFLNEGRLSTRSETFRIGSSLKWDTGVSWDSGIEWPGEASDVVRTFINRVAQTVAPQWDGDDDFEVKGYQVVYSDAE